MSCSAYTHQRILKGNYSLTFYSSPLFSPLEEEVFRALGTEWQGHQLERREQEGECKQYTPAVKLAVRATKGLGDKVSASSNKFMTVGTSN